MRHKIKSREENTTRGWKDLVRVAALAGEAKGPQTSEVGVYETGLEGGHPDKIEGSEGNASFCKIHV